MEFFNQLEEILQEPRIPQRFELFDRLYALFQHSISPSPSPILPHSSLRFAHDSRVRPILSPIYAKHCKILPSSKLKRAQKLNSDAAMALFLHSLAHIEYSAIDLALDACYRFRSLPLEFYADWLEVAREEIYHFKLLQTLLQTLGYTYGDFAVHSKLFDAMKATPSFADRMALVHRGLEAAGLDANPFVSQKVALSSHPLSPEILHTLERIFQDEIGHVSKGDRWWRYAQDPRSFQEILEHYAYNLPKTLNIQARLQCGFTLEELEALAATIPPIPKQRNSYGNLWKT